MNTSSDSFGRRLKLERQRRGISLESIAASTKIKRSLLVDLERDNLSKWPQGIFGRSFVREYAASIGLSPEPVVAEFVRLFAEQQTGEVQSQPSAEPAELRLSLADGGRESLAVTAARMAAAALEACLVAAGAQAVAWSTGLNFWTVCGTASLSYYGIASACWGRSPASRWLQRDHKTAAAGGEPVRTDSRGMLELLVERAGLESYTPGATAGTVDVGTGS